MNNCNAGIDHLTLGPDGKLYICPAFYYKKMEYNIDKLFNDSLSLTNILKLENSPICLNCDAFQCKRCPFLNYYFSNEFNIPGRDQCHISHIEREVSQYFQRELQKRDLIDSPGLYTIPDLPYNDPFIISKRW